MSNTSNGFYQSKYPGDKIDELLGYADNMVKIEIPEIKEFQGLLNNNKLELKVVDALPSVGEGEFIYLKQEESEGLLYRRLYIWNTSTNGWCEIVTSDIANLLSQKLKTLISKESNARKEADSKIESDLLSKLDFKEGNGNDIDTYLDNEPTLYKITTDGTMLFNPYYLIVMKCSYTMIPGVSVKTHVQYKIASHGIYRRYYMDGVRVESYWTGWEELSPGTDTTPTEGSKKFITSGGVYGAIQELEANKADKTELSKYIEFENITVSAIKGSEASVEKVVTDNIMNLNFVLPKGDKGEQGVSGVYVGTGDMPEGYNVQIDPNGTTVEIDELKSDLVDKVNGLGIVTIDDCPENQGFFNKNWNVISSSYIHRVVPVKSGDVIKAKFSQYTYYAMLKSYKKPTVVGEPVDFSSQDGFTSMKEVNGEVELSVTVPNDCNYMIFTTVSNNIKNQVMYFYVNQYDLTKNAQSTILSIDEKASNNKRIIERLDISFEELENKVEQINSSIELKTNIGKNVLDISKEGLVVIKPDGTKKYGVIINGLDGDYIISFTGKTSLGYYPSARTIRNGEYSAPTEARNGTVLTVEQGDSLILYIGNEGIKMSDVLGNIQLEKGTTATAYEPFSSFTDAFRIKDLEERVTSVETNDDIVAEMISAYDSHGIFESNIEVALSENGNEIYYCSNCNKIVAKYFVESLVGSIGRTIRLESGGKGSLAYVDFEHNTIGFASVLSSYTTNDSITKLTESIVPFTFVAGRDYIIEDKIIEDLQTLTIRDGFSSEYFSVSRTLSSYNMRNGKYKSVPIGSGITLVSVKGYLLQPKNPKVAIFGDSFVEGYFPYRYGTLLKRELKGNVYLDGNSGCVTGNALSRLDYAKKYINPEYVILALGTNDLSFDSWKSNMENCIAKVESMGATPIIPTITFWNSDTHNDMAKQANAWIKASGYKYVDFNRLTSVDYLCETKNTSMFRSDGTHPTNETFKLMYDLLHCDVPEIFND